MSVPNIVQIHKHKINSIYIFNNYCIINIHILLNYKLKLKYHRLIIKTMYDRIDLAVGCMLLTAFTSSLATGLIITFATSGGINEGAVPLSVAACIFMGSVFLTCLYKVVIYIDGGN